MGFFEEWLERGFSLPGWGLEFCYFRRLFGASYQNDISHMDQTIHPTSGYRASKSLPCQSGDAVHPRALFLLNCRVTEGCASLHGGSPTPRRALGLTDCDEEMLREGLRGLKVGGSKIRGGGGVGGEGLSVGGHC